MPENPSAQMQSSYRGFVQFRVLGADFLLVKPSFSQPFFRLLTQEEINKNAAELPLGWHSQPQEVNPNSQDDQKQLGEWFQGDPTLLQLFQDFGGGAIPAFLDLVEQLSVREIKAAFSAEGFQAKLTLSLIFKDQAGPGSGIGYENWIRFKEFELRVTQTTGGFSEQDWKQMEEKAKEEWEWMKEEREWMATASRI
jgi:hypothetical protein